MKKAKGKAQKSDRATKGVGAVGSRYPVFACILLVVAAGITAVTMSGASIAAWSTEAESGERSASAMRIVRADASGSAAVMFGVATAPDSTEPPPITDGGRTLWRGGAEQGRSAWSAEHMESPTRATVVNGFNGRMAWRMQVLPGDDVTGARAEFGQDDGGDAYRDSHAFTIGSESWVGYSFYMPDGFPTDANWTCLTQWKDLPDLGSPSFCTDISDGKIRLGDMIDVPWSAPAQTGVWHNFVIHQKVRTDSAGLFKVFYSTGNTKPAVVHTKNGATSRGSTWLVPRMGYYRDPGITSTTPVYHARYAVGTSFDAVTPVW